MKNVISRTAVVVGTASLLIALSGCAGNQNEPINATARGANANAEQNQTSNIVSTTQDLEEPGSEEIINDEGNLDDEEFFDEDLENADSESEMGEDDPMNEEFSDEDEFFDENDEEYIPEDIDESEFYEDEGVADEEDSF
jgi:hypothetical protein